MLIMHYYLEYRIHKLSRRHKCYGFNNVKPKTQF